MQAQVGRAFVGAASGRDAATTELSGRAAGYAQAVCELNQAVADSQPFDAIAAFAAACTDEPPRAPLPPDSRV